MSLDEKDTIVEGNKPETSVYQIFLYKIKTSDYWEAFITGQLLTMTCLSGIVV